MTVILSLLPLAMASSTKAAAASEAECRLPSPPRRLFSTTWHATSLDTMSHRPSVAIIMKSSDPVRFVTVTSGWELMYGFRWWSPVGGEKSSYTWYIQCVCMVKIIFKKWMMLLMYLWILKWEAPLVHANPSGLWYFLPQPQPSPSRLVDRAI